MSINLSFLIVLSFHIFRLIINSGSNPVLIALPEELAGMTLESRLISYDWKNQFDSFQNVTRTGTFKTICWDAKNIPIPVSDGFVFYWLLLYQVFS